MQSPGSHLSIVCALLCGALCCVDAVAAASPGFTLTAANTTMPANGAVASSPFTLASVNGYAGQVRIGCSYSGSAMRARVPSCAIFVNPVSTLAPNQSVQGSLTLVPYGKMTGYGAASLHRSPASMLAGAIVGLFLLRKRFQHISLLLTLALSCVGFVALSACAAGKSGTFPFTATAVDVKSGVTVSAPFTVTVP